MSKCADDCLDGIIKNSGSDTNEVLHDKFFSMIGSFYNKIENVNQQVAAAKFFTEQDQNNTSPNPASWSQKMGGPGL